MDRQMTAEEILDLIWKQVRSSSYYAPPSIIIMHPDNLQKLIDYVRYTSTIDFQDMNDIKVFGIRTIRSYDLKLNEIKVY